VLSSLGTLVWNMLLIGSGFLISGSSFVEHYLNPIANIIIGFFVLAYVLQVLRFHTRRRRKSETL
jgi:membrane protein DedA with SNARE-associated domain